MQEIEGQGGRVTLGMMVDLVRGAGGGSYGVSGESHRRKGKAKEKAELNLDAIAGGKVNLSKDVSLTSRLGGSVLTITDSHRMRRRC